MDRKPAAGLVWLAVAGAVCVATALQLMGVLPPPVATAIVLASLAAAWLVLRRPRQ